MPKVGENYMHEVVGSIIVFWGRFIALILWATGGRAETINETESDMP